MTILLNHWSRESVSTSALKLCDIFAAARKGPVNHRRQPCGKTLVFSVVEAPPTNSHFGSG
jgi:hypothetical protein